MGSDIKRIEAVLKMARADLLDSDRPVTYIDELLAELRGNGRPPKMHIKVEFKNEILGDGVFWHGPVDQIDRIRNIPARETAKLVAKDGKKRVSGMWHVSAYEPEVSDVE